MSVTAANVGPFDLGTVVIHFPLTSTPKPRQSRSPRAPPTRSRTSSRASSIHVRNIRAYIDRDDFMLNPTSCAPTSLSATVIGGGASFTDPADDDPVTVNDPFQAADCANLAFKPKFTASTPGKTSKARRREPDT